MWLMWVMVVLAVAMVVGPVMMLQPSKGLAKIAALRSHASQLGLTVHLPSREADGKPVRGAIYRMPLPEAIGKRKNFASWRVKRQKHTHGIHFHGEWDWASESRAPEAITDELRRQLDTLPESIAALECTTAGVGLQWDERCHGEQPEPEVEKLRDRLQGLSQALVAGYAKVPLVR